MNMSKDTSKAKRRKIRSEIVHSLVTDESMLTEVLKSTLQLLPPDSRKKATHDLIEQLNASYLAGMIDWKGCSVQWKNGKPASVRISFGSSGSDAPRIYDAIDNALGLNGISKRRNPDFGSKPYFLKLKEAGFDQHKKLTHCWVLDEPSYVLNVASVCLPYSERKQRLEEVIKAAGYLLANKEGGVPDVA